MREVTTAGTLISLLIFMRDKDQRHVLLVEGDEDVRLLAPMVEHSRARLLPTRGKQNAHGVLRAANGPNPPDIGSVTALLDRDWVGDVESIEPGDRHSYTDGYDLYGSVFSLPGVLERVIASHAPANAVQRLANLAARVAELTGVVGHLRRLSVARRWELNTSSVPWTDLLAELQRNGIDAPRAVVAVVLPRSPNATASSEVIEAELRASLDRDCRPVQWFSRGHDVSRLIPALLASIGPSAGWRRPTPAAVEASAATCGSIPYVVQLPSLRQMERVARCHGATVLIDDIAKEFGM